VGLIAATPSSGFLPPWSSPLLGILAATCCNFATKFKGMVGIDDAMDIFAEHGVGGMVGLLFTALCADSTITGLDGVTTDTKGGIMNNNWSQLRIQAVYIAATALYTFSVSMVLLKIIDYIPALRLRCSEEEESVGMDAVAIGEFANDFVESRPDYRDWAQSASRQSRNSMAFIIGPSHLRGRDSDEVSQHESIVNHSDIKRADDKEDFALEKEIPSPYFELPCTPKKAHARLVTPKATQVKLPTPELNGAEPKSPNPSSRCAPPEYIKPPNL